MADLVKPELMLLDLDGVVLNSIPLHIKIRCEVGEQFGLPLERIQELEGQGRSAHAVLGALGYSRRFIRRYIRAWMEKERAARPLIFPGLADALLELRALGVTLGIITNRPLNAHLAWVLRHCGIPSTIFSFAVGYAPLPFRAKLGVMLAEGILTICPLLCARWPKPDARAIEPARTRFPNLFADPRAVWYAGDTLIDLEFARNCGFTFFAVCTGAVQERKTWEAHGADLVIENAVLLPLLVRP